MGHARNYTINDMMARQLAHEGYNVLIADGLGRLRPAAENAAMHDASSRVQSSQAEAARIWLFISARVARRPLRRWHAVAMRRSRPAGRRRPSPSA